MKTRVVNTLAICFTLFIFWIIYRADTGGTLFFTKMFRFLPFPDKWGHFILFGILTLLINVALKYKRFPIGKYPIYLGTIWVSVFVVVEELSQGLLATRSMDYLDVLADGVGIVLFSWGTWVLERRG